MSESQALSEAALPGDRSTAAGTSAAGALFERLPRWVAETLTAEQKDAIAQAMREPPWKVHPVDIRLTVPFLKRGLYVTVVGGGEKRGRERRARDRGLRPMRTAANVLFMLGIATILYLAAFVAIALYAAIIEF